MSEYQLGLLHGLLLFVVLNSVSIELGKALGKLILSFRKKNNEPYSGGDEMTALVLIEGVIGCGS